MSRDVWIEVVIAGQLNQQVVENILQCGARYGCVYFDPKDDGELDISRSSISSTNAAQYIMEALYARLIDPQDIESMPAIHFQCEEAVSTLIFGSWRNGSGTKIVLNAWIDRWLKGNPHDNMIDWARYIQLVLALCQDFPILMLKTDDSYFESQ